MPRVCQGYLRRLQPTIPRPSRRATGAPARSGLGRRPPSSRAEASAGWKVSGGSESFAVFATLAAKRRAGIEERRLAANTLLWRSGPLLLRLESRLDLERTLEIARSIRRP
jgi:hypothetical protein